MKRFISVFVMAFLLTALFCGCGRSDGEPAGLPDVPITEPTQTQEPTVAVDESVFYFSNESEYGRLYSQRLDGTDLKLVVDSYTYDVRQSGDSVYYNDGDDLCVYHIPTGKSTVLVEGTYLYAVDEYHLVYFVDNYEWYQTDVRYRNLANGEEKSLGTIMNGGDCAIANDKLYYIKYDIEAERSFLCVCDLLSFETVTVAEELDSYYRLQAVSDGVYFEGYTMESGFAQYFVSSDGSGLRRIWGGLTENCQMFHESEAGILCVHTVFEETGSRSCIHRHNPDGTVTELLSGKGDGYITVKPVKSGLWLADNTYYDEWSSENFNKGEIHYVIRKEYSLMDEAGAVTPIHALGETGKLFADGDYPVMDSSTARMPVTAELYTLFVGNHGHEGAKPICSTTHGAWLNIADRKVDIALLAAPTQEELDYLRERDVSIEMKLYGGDGLVFIGNAANPVQNLTREQIIGIYQGKIKNWSEVGGPDKAITVYYRDDQSGSQRLFESMVFKGLELPEYEKLGFTYMDEMSTIVDIVLQNPYSIGYSIMTYLDDVYENDDLKVFAVDGVVPSVDTVKNSTYPYHTRGFVVIRSDEPAGSPARRLYDWFGSPICNEILENCGITPLQGNDGVG